MIFCPKVLFSHTPTNQRGAFSKAMLWNLAGEIFSAYRPAVWLRARVRAMKHRLGWMSSPLKEYKTFYSAHHLTAFGNLTRCSHDSRACFHTLYIQMSRGINAHRDVMPWQTHIHTSARCECCAVWVGADERKDGDKTRRHARRLNTLEAPLMVRWLRESTKITFLYFQKSQTLWRLFIYRSTEQPCFTTAWASVTSSAT